MKLPQLCRARPTMCWGKKYFQLCNIQNQWHSGIFKPILVQKWPIPFTKTPISADTEIRLYFPGLLSGATENSSSNLQKKKKNRIFDSKKKKCPHVQKVKTDCLLGVGRMVLVSRLSIIVTQTNRGHFPVRVCSVALWRRMSCSLKRGVSRLHVSQRKHLLALTLPGW